MIRTILKELMSPGREFSPIPFWFLNDELSEEEIERQLTDFCEKGVFGVVLHPRIGLPESIPYLSERFMHYIRFAVKTAARLGMKVVIYDEAMYPSGSAHGLVAREDPRFAAQAIILTEDPTEGRLIAACENGRYIVQVPSGGTIRGIHYGEDDGEAHAPLAADLLSQAAVDTFIRLTYRRYYDELREYFGETVIGFFTDEPSLLGRCERAGCFPFTFGFEEDFTAAGGRLSELAGLFTKEENDSTALYREMILARELEVYYTSLHRFCKEHGVLLMGHPHRGDDIEHQRFFDIPGQDMVWRWIAPEKDPLGGVESAQGKCTSDAARIKGSRRNSSECFGVCVRDGIPWYFTGGDMKWYIDYLGVRGVNLFIPHAFFYSVRGARKDERPPDVGPHSIFWAHYRKVSNYIGRISYIMTDSKNEARVAVLCENRDLRIERVRELYQNQVEFNYLPYSALSKATVTGDTLAVGDNTYRYVYCDDRALVPTVTSITGVADLPYRDLYTESPTPALRLSRLSKYGVRMLLITNEGEDSIETEAAIEGEASLLAFDLWRGECYREDCTARDGKTHFHLSLARRESRLLILDPLGSIAAPRRPQRRYVQVGLSFVSEDTAAYVKTYTGTLIATREEGESAWLRVTGEEMAECYVNGRFVDASLWSPHEFDLSGYLTEGENTVTVRITGNAANRFTDRRIAYGLGVRLTP